MQARQKSRWQLSQAVGRRSTWKVLQQFAQAEAGVVGRGPPAAVGAWWAMDGQWEVTWGQS